MKILFVTSLYPSDDKPQYCIFLEQQAQGLKRLGHIVEILHLEMAPNIEREEIAPPFLRNGLQVYAWKRHYHRLAELSVYPAVSGTLSKFFAEHTYDAVSLHMGSLRVFMELSRVCKEFGIAVIQHYHGLNIWNDYHQATKQKILSFYQGFFKRHFLKTVSAVVGVSEQTCEIARKHYSGPIYTVYNGVDLTLFQQQEKASGSTFTILCVANLIPIKGHTYLIHAIREVLQKGYSVNLRIIGEGTERQSLEELCAKLALGSHVEFLGALPYPAVAKEMASADMFIMPSYFEAFGCVYIEAMASGVLTCGCAGNGAAEIITHGENGLLVKEKDVASIVDAIIFALTVPEQASKLAEEGKRRAAEFSWDASAKSLERVYYQTVGFKSYQAN